MSVFYLLIGPKRAYSLGDTTTGLSDPKRIFSSSLRRPLTMSRKNIPKTTKGKEGALVAEYIRQHGCVVNQKTGARSIPRRPPPSNHPSSCSCAPLQTVSHRVTCFSNSLVEIPTFITSLKITHRWDLWEPQHTLLLILLHLLCFTQAAHALLSPWDRFHTSTHLST